MVGAFEEEVEIAAGVGEEALEAGHLVGIEAEGDEVAVVEVFMQPGFEAVAAPAAVKLAEVVAKGGEDGGFFLPHEGGGLAGGVEGGELGAGALDFMVELAAAAETALVLPQIGKATGGEEPALHAFFGDGVGEGFVEEGVAPVEEFVVGEFVEEGLGEVDVGVVEEGVEDGVVEPAEGGVGIDAADEDVVVLGAELLGEGDGGLLAEVATVVHGADEGVVPGFGFQGELGGGVEDPDDVVTPEIGVFPVAGGAGEGEVSGGKAADLLDGGELATDGWRGGGIGKDGGDGAALGEDFPLAADGLAVELGGLAGNEQPTGGAECGEEDGEARHGGGEISGERLDGMGDFHKR